MKSIHQNPLSLTTPLHHHDSGSTFTPLRDSASRSTKASVSSPIPLLSGVRIRRLEVEVTFTTGALGTYALQVQYTLNGVTVTAATGQINVFGVTIVTLSSFPANVSVDNALQLDCQPMGAGWHRHL